MKRQPRRRMGWIAFGLGMIAFRVVLEWAPLFAETFYGRGVFQINRFLLDHTFGLLPFPAVYLVIPALLLWGVYAWKHRKREARSLPRRLGSGMVSLLAAAFGTVGLFLFLWGFNYARIPLRHQLELDIHTLDTSELFEEFKLATEALNRHAANTPEKPGTDLENRIRNAVEGVLGECEWPTAGRVRVRKFRPGSWLLTLGIAGIYNPFTGEATLPAGIPAVTHPFLAAHEAAHAYGVTDEGEANLVAFLACVRGGDADLIYSGHLALWRYLAGPVSRSDPAFFRGTLKTLSSRVMNDLRKINEHNQKYRGPISRVAQQVNDTYLRSQGVRAGVRSYAGFPALLRAWRLRRQERVK